MSRLLQAHLGWPELGALLAAGAVLYGYVAVAVHVVAVAHQPLVAAVLRSRFRMIMNALGTIASPAVVVAPFALPVGAVLAIAGLFAHGPWRLVAVADLVLLVPLAAVFARFGAPMLLDDD